MLQQEADNGLCTFLGAGQSPSTEEETLHDMYKTPVGLL